MLCEQCRKREATVKYVEVAGGVKTEHNLCAQCAGKLDLGQYSALFEGEFPLGKLLSGLLGIPDAAQDESRFAGVVCPVCGTTYEDFVKNSRFGCGDCYSVFDPLIGENIRHLQGSERHVGNGPLRMGTRQKRRPPGKIWGTRKQKPRKRERTGSRGFPYSLKTRSGERITRRPQGSGMRSGD